MWGHFLYKYSVFESYFYCYSATYGPISMKLCKAVKDNVTNVFTNFHKVSRFCLGFIGLWVCVATPTFLNEPILANQRTKFHFFSIIIDLESPEIITAVVWSRLRKNQRLVRKSRFLQICEYLMNDLIDSNGSRGKVAHYDTSYQMICILCG